MRHSIMPLAAAVLLTAAMTTAGCAWLRYRAAEPPSVALASAELVEFSMTGQRLRLELRVRNPNGFELPVAGLEYTLAVNDKPLASGRSTRAFTLPAVGETTVPVTLEANLIESGIITGFAQVQSWREAGGAEFDYALSGKLKLADLSAAMPFSRTGSVYVDLSDW